MAGQRNQIEFKNDRVVKTFGSHLDYVTENGIYEKLRGTKLVPELLYSGGDVIEHELLAGPTLFEALIRSVDDARAMEESFRRFAAWYAAFRRCGGYTLGNIDFRKFIVQEDGLRYVDLEHCRAGYAETDIAKLTSQMYLVPQPFSQRAAGICRLFIATVGKSLDLSGERLSAEIEKELTRICKLLNIEYDQNAAAAFLSEVPGLCTKN